jgi:integrase
MPSNRPESPDDAKASRLAGLVEARRAAPATRPPEPEEAPARSRRRTNLTDRKLAELAAKGLTRRLDIADAALSGLTARIAPSGRITFTFRLWAQGAFRRVTLDAADVAEARAKAIQAKTAASIGRDPRATSAAHSAETARTLAETVPDYLGALRRRGRAEGYLRNVERLFANHVLPRLGRKRLLDLTRADLAALYAQVADTRSAKAKGRGGRLAAMPNRVHAQMSGLLTWAEQEGRLPPGTVPRMPRPVAEEPSARALREEAKVLLRPEHIARIWLAVGDDPPHVRCLVRLLCLLPLRREELTRLTWGELRGVLPEDNLLMADAELFQGPRLELEAARMKGRRPQVMPLPPAAVALLREAHEARGADGSHVFSASAGRAPYTGWRRLAAGLREACRDVPSGWVVHDIRGGIATALGEAGEDEAVIARLLHHAPAARIGITARYDRSRRLQPMLDALALWEATLLKGVAAEERRAAAAVA